ncbi:TetR/AcrR family transcriptional regulator [Frankia gtarii]|uniref:TetR/AcrR family transcriptional regulator n=1 Tax=Frankia gtarii TaxID=2950102 RepID=UPI0021BFDAE3|nr:TetR/AcrR family transcriptional regulator [Frankia gtarii]
MEPPPGLRERTRRAVRSELMTVAMSLFAEQGYDATTIDQIASAAGLSKRSFFRYFASKEEVILVNFEAFGRALADAVGQRPPQEGAWLALRRAFDLVEERNRLDPGRTFVLLRMLHETPALKAAHLEKQARWRELLVPGVIDRLSRTAVPAGSGSSADSGSSAGFSPSAGAAPAAGPPAADERAGSGVERRAAAVVAAALACLDAAQSAWCDAGGHASLAALLDEAMGAVAPLHG